MVKSTPSTPPNIAIAIVSMKGKSIQYRNSTSAGRVKMTPAASDSPAEAAVCTMLFSRMFDRLNSRRTAIEMTAAGIDAETVMPTFSPR